MLQTPLSASAWGEIGKAADPPARRPGVANRAENAKRSAEIWHKTCRHNKKPPENAAVGKTLQTDPTMVGSNVGTAKQRRTYGMVPL